MPARTTAIRDESGEPVAITSINWAAPATSSEARDADIDDQREFRRALDLDEFEIYYQPFVALADLHVVAVEALVRWNHPALGLRDPAGFIKAAERSGLIVEMGLVVLEKACRQAAGWRRSGVDVELAVNCSTRQLSEPDLVDRVVAVLAATGMEAGSLWFEVTESALVEDVDTAVKLLDRLVAAGIRIAIDDFGTGWGSLTYLKCFPVEALKIDGSFVAGVGNDANDTAIVRSILSLGAELGVAVIAEGIETEAQAHALRQLGCVFGQGFLYGRPTPAAAVPIHRTRRLDRADPRASTEGRARSVAALVRDSLTPPTDFAVELSEVKPSWTFDRQPVRASTFVALPRLRGRDRRTVVGLERRSDPRRPTRELEVKSSIGIAEVVIADVAQSCQAGLQRAAVDRERGGRRVIVSAAFEVRVERCHELGAAAAVVGEQRAEPPIDEPVDDSEVIAGTEYLVHTEIVEDDDIRAVDERGTHP